MYEFSSLANISHWQYVPTDQLLSTINFPLVKSCAFWHKLSTTLIKWSQRNGNPPYVVIILPNLMFAVNPLPTPLLSEVNTTNIWFPEDLSREGAEFPVTELNNSSLSLPSLLNFKLAFPS